MTIEQGESDTQDKAVPDDVVRVLGVDAVHCDGCGGWHHARYHDRRVDDLIGSYEAKVDDLRQETLRSSAWRDACRWAVRALSDRERTFVLNGEGWAPPDIEPLLAEALEAGLPERAGWSAT